jgi:hypothetical protein
VIILQYLTYYFAPRDPSVGEEVDVFEVVWMRSWSRVSRQIEDFMEEDKLRTFGDGIRDVEHQWDYGDENKVVGVELKSAP